MVPQSSRIYLLASYYYLRKSTRFCDAVFAAAAGGATVMIDCGAHSLYQAKAKGAQVKPIDVGTYCEFLESNKSSVWQAIALDVVKDKDQTAVNLKFMLDRGLRPMPVMVYGMPDEDAIEMVKINPHICVAGGRDARMPWLYQRFIRIAKCTDGQAKTHGLAFVKYPDYLRLPIYSVDSVSWKSGAMFGLTRSFNPTAGQQIVVAKRKQTIRKSASEYMVLVGQYESLLQSHNASAYRNDPTLTTGFKAFAHAKNCSSMIEQMEYSRKHGRHVFAVVTQEVDLTLFAAVLPTLRQDFVFDYADMRNRIDMLASVSKERRSNEIEAAFRQHHNRLQGAE